ncbi:DUF669 domain-containing protein [bacterium]|nr:DUF669 domain-containing protein [bacterium]
MANLQGFDARNFPAFGFRPLPDGKYVAVIIGSEFKTTRDGSGVYLELKFQVAEGEHKGRIVWARLNLQNRSPEAVRIAQSQLSTICHAVDVLTPQSSEDLHYRPLVIRVVCKKRTETGEMVNEICGYSKLVQTPQDYGPVPDTPWNS